MKNLLKLLLSVAMILSASLVFAFESEKIMERKIAIIPEPVILKLGAENSSPFVINKKTVILLASEEGRNSAAFLNNYLQKYYGFSLKVVNKFGSKFQNAIAEVNTISMSVDKEGVKNAFNAISASASTSASASASAIEGYLQNRNEGAYFMSTANGNATPNANANASHNGCATLTGADAQGLFYAVQSLIQLLPADINVVLAPGKTDNSAAIAKSESKINYKTFEKTPSVSSLQVPAVEVLDYPRFGYRGMHFDVVRHIFSTDYIKQFIDYLACHKMNYFHLHLTDDQAWRIESKKYPKLNSIGSWRDGTIIGIFPGTGVDSTRYGGFYTAEQLKDIVKYAADRYITVVPEIDVPGHSMAIIASYPQFSTTPEIPKKPAITWGIYNRQNNVLAPSEEVFVFLADVFNELMDIFPGPYIHIGADECAKRWWKESESTQAYMRSKGLKDENELQKYFVERISEVVTGRGRQIVGWDEMIDDGLIAGSVVMSWRNEKGGHKAAKMGHKAIMTPMVYSYFNIAQKENEEGLAHKSWLTTLDSVYLFEPIPDGFPAEAAANILGGQGCMWTEYFANKEQVEYGIFPRLSAISEVYWSPRQNRDIVNFRDRLQAQYKRYDLWGANYYAGERK